MQKHDILTQFDFFGRAPDELKQQIVDASTTVSLPADTYCFYEADQCKTIALVGTGLVRVYKASPQGREVTLYHVGPGELCLLTMQAALTGERFAASAVTRTSVDAALLPVDRFREWAAAYPYLQALVLETMTRRVSELMILVQEIAFRRLDQRLAAFLLDRTMGQPVDDLRVSLTHEAIAVELGTAREVVSRLLKDLERLGTIDLSRGQIRLNGRDALAAVLDRPS